jgi:hypothetical protein
MAKAGDENCDAKWDDDSDAESLIPEEDELADLENKEFAARYLVW